MWPGNTADVGVLVPVIDRLRSRFGIGRVCVVADRGMISAATITALEERGLEYVLGARERTDTLVRTVVLADKKPFTPLCVERANGEQTQLFARRSRSRGGATSSAATRPRRPRTLPIARPSSPGSISSSSAATKR